MNQKIERYIKNPALLFVFLGSRGFFNWLSDKRYLQIVYRIKMGKALDLAHPVTFNEKMQWLKLYDRKPVYTVMADKYKAKKYVAGIIGREYIIKTLGVWNRFEDIDFEQLPDRFVLKCTHNSGGLVIVDDKRNMNKNAGKILNKCLKRNYYNNVREWPYKNIKPRIIAEEYIGNGNDMMEYKVTCFNGRAGFITICTGPAHTDTRLRTNDSYDLEFHHMPWYATYKNSKRKFNKPKEWDLLIKLSEKIAKDIPYLRVDWYICNGRLYFGENTFYTWGGYCDFTPEEWDYKLGRMIKLSL